MDSSYPSTSPEPPLQTLTRKPHTTALNNAQSLAMPAPHIIHAFSNFNRQIVREVSSPHKEMDPKTSLLTQAYKPGKNNRHDCMPEVEPEDRRSSRESSSESLIVCQKWLPEQTEPGRDKATARRDTAHPTSVSLNTPTSKHRKKPGPQPKVPKPLKKSDAGARMKIIREIEEHWGKNFIVSCIPRCHHPLVKSTKGKKHRSHERDPKNWLPSILKSLIVIAKLTQDKAWLKKAMNDVVRYRIKHTGNRKPQLTTTDFDVLEDMLTKGWKVEYSFPIRYKHLFGKGKNEEVNDDDIDHIMGLRVRSRASDDPDIKSEDEYSENTEDGDFMDIDSVGEHGPTEPQNNPSSPQQKVKQVKKSKQANNPWDYTMHGYGNNPMNPPQNAAYNGYALYGGLPPNYGSYSNYNLPSQDNREHPPSWPQYGYGTHPWSPHLSPRPPLNPTNTEPSTQPAYMSTPFSPPTDLHPFRETNQHPSPSIAHQSLESRTHAENFTARPSPQLDLATHLGSDEAGLGIRYAVGEAVDDEAAAIEAELMATRLELKIARLEAKQAALKMQAKGR